MKLDKRILIGILIIGIVAIGVGATRISSFGCGQSPTEKDSDAAFQAGYEDGYTIGYSKGYNACLEAFSDVPTPPLSGVTAICNDGTYSYSKHRSGTCSHHGGVREWINRPPS